MKGGQTPIHIMRMAPADYVNDPFVRRLYQQGDYRTAAFYPVFLFYSHMEGGDLPADLTKLSAIVLMSRQDVAASVRICKRAGKIHEEDGRLYHRRVRREVLVELEYRRQQAEKGRMGGRPKKPPYDEGGPKGGLSGNQSPPPSTPAPPSTPPSAPPSTPPPAGPAGGSDAEDDTRRYGSPGEAEEVRAQIRIAKAEASRLTRRPEGELVAEASRTPNRQAFHDEANCASVPWLRKTLEKLITMRFQAQADQRDRPPPPPTDRATAREHAALAGIQGGKTPTTSRILEGMRRDRRSLGRGDDVVGGEPPAAGSDAPPEGDPGRDDPGRDGTPQRRAVGTGRPGGTS